MRYSYIGSFLFIATSCWLYNDVMSEPVEILLQIPSNLKDRLDWHTKMESSYGMLYKFRKLFGARFLGLGIDEYAAPSEGYLTMSSHYIAMFRELVIKDDYDCGIYKDSVLNHSQYVDYFNIFCEILMSLHADFVELMNEIGEWKETIKRNCDLNNPKIYQWFENRGFTDPLNQLKPIDVDDVLVNLRNMLGPDQPLCNLLDSMGLRKAVLYPTVLGDQLAWLYGFSDQLNNDDLLYQPLYNKFEATFPGKGRSHMKTLKRLSTHGNSIIGISGSSNGASIYPKHMNVWEVTYFFPSMIDRYFDILVSFVPDMLSGLKELADACEKWAIELSISDTAKEYMSTRAIDTELMGGSSSSLAERIKTLCNKGNALGRLDDLIKSYNDRFPAAAARGACVRDNKVPPPDYIPIAPDITLPQKSDVNQLCSPNRRCGDGESEKCQSSSTSHKNGDSAISHHHHVVYSSFTMATPWILLFTSLLW